MIRGNQNMKRLLAQALALMLALGIGAFAPAAADQDSLQAAGFNADNLYELGYALKHLSPVAPALNDMALKSLRASAALGNGNAWVQLGEMYLGGRIPLENGQDRVQEAMKCWKLAWEKGATRAYHNLGLLYYGVAVPGTGGAGVGVVKQDYDKAFQYFKAAADLGDTKAIRYTGLCYENGFGVKQDYAQAAKYYRIIGGYYFANLLLVGKGIGQDVKKALEIYESVAARNGGGQEDQYAAYALAQIYEKGSYVKEDKNKAMEYYQTAAGKGSAAAKAKLADYAAELYKDASALLKAGKYDSAIPQLIKAANLGNVDALKITGTGRK
jgi:uncharacterized protein